MLTPEGLASILVALLALLGTIVIGISNRGKLSKDDAVKLEHRLTIMEQNKFTQEDRKILTILNERVSNMMTTLATLIPKTLKNPGNLDPILDTLSEKAATEGWSGVVDFVKTELEEQERADLLAYLEKKANSRSKQLRLWAGLYLGMLKLELNPPPNRFL